MFFPLTGAANLDSFATKDIGEIRKMRYAIAAAIFALAVSGSGVMATDGSIDPPPEVDGSTPPSLNNADLDVVSGWHASETARAAVEGSPVFHAASPTKM